MIVDYLSDLDAEIFIFAPQDSRDLGRRKPSEPVV